MRSQEDRYNQKKTEQEGKTRADERLLDREGNAEVSGDDKCSK